MHHEGNPRAGIRRAVAFALASVAGAVLVGDAPSADASGHGPSVRGPATDPPAPAPAAVALSAARMPVRFEANEGQSGTAVRWLARCRGFTLFLADDAAVFRLGGNAPKATPEPRTGSLREHPDGGPGGVLRMGFVGARPSPRFDSLGLLGSVSNYFLGNDPSRWRSGVRNHAGVSLRGLWPGVDLAFRGDPSRLEYSLSGAPGADPARVRFSLEGPRAARVDGEGDLVLAYPDAEVRMSAPVAWQEGADGVRRDLAVSFRLDGEGNLGFDLGNLDPALPWVVDPTVNFATYLGGATSEEIYDVAVDPNGRVLASGYTTSTDFPLQSAFQGTYVGSTGTPANDSFLTVYNSSLASVAFSTYIGGNGYDQAHSVTSDPSGNLILAGVTSATDFPTSSAFQGSNALGPHDIFVVKFNSTGSSLTFSTFLGASGEDWAFDCAADSSGIYLVGLTSSTTFPTVSPAQVSHAGGTFDAILVKMASNGGSLAYSTYYGGTGVDGAYDLAVDGNGALYVCGFTDSTGFPTVSPLQASHAGGPAGSAFDGFLMKLGSGGSVAYATFLGGSGRDDARCVGVNGSGEVFVLTETDSTNFPTVSPVQATFGGAPRDAALTKVNASGSSILAGTYLGGSVDELARGLAIDSTGAVTICGATNSSNFPVGNAFQGTYQGGTPSAQDAWVAKYAASGTTLLYSSYIASAGGEAALCAAADPNDGVIVAGWTQSNAFPTQSPIQAFGGGTVDGFVLRIVPNPPGPPTGLSATAQGASSIQLGWTDGSTNESNFEIEKKTGMNPFAKIAQVAAGAVAYQDFSVSPGTTYTYRVRAINADGPSGYSNEASATTGIIVPPPAVPGDFTATVIGPTTVDLAWTDRSGNEISFELQRKAGTGTYVVAASLPADSTAYRNNGLSPDTVYTYRLRAVGASAVSGFTPEAGAITDPTFTLLTTKGQVTDSSKPGKDKIKVSGTVAFLPASPDGAFNPTGEVVTIALVSDASPVTFIIPAGDPGWKLKGSKYTWKSPKDALTKLALTIDTAKATVKIGVTKLSLPAAPANPIRVSLRAGTDAGSHRAAWSTGKPGQFKFP